MKDLVIEILESLEAVSGRLEKEAILRNHKDNYGLKQVMLFTLDPTIDFGIKKFNKVNSKDKFLLIEVYKEFPWKSFLAMLAQFNMRAITGNAAKKAVEDFYSHCDDVSKKWVERIILRNLRCGVNTSTVEKIWPGLLTSFEPQAANTLDVVIYDKTKKRNPCPEPDYTSARTVQNPENPDEYFVFLDSVSFPRWVDPKFDGLRTVAFKRNGKVELKTRNGSAIDTLPQIKKTLEDLPYDNFVLDGEGMAADWNQSSSIIMSDKNTKDDSDMVYRVFSGLTIEEWDKQVSTTSYESRKDKVSSILGELRSNSKVQPVQGKIVKTYVDIINYYLQCLSEGYEGIMIKDLNAPYAFKRSDAILKLKPSATYEGVIVGWYEGNKGTKWEGKFGGFSILLDNGIITNCGGGFKDEHRIEFGKNPESYYGKILEVKGQPPLTKDGKIRFPRWTHKFRDWKDVDPKLKVVYDNYKG